MENAIKFLRIQNFKSIKDVTLHPRRVNLIIGEPNVGKSNLLEAMSLLGGMVYEQKERFMGSFIRYEEPQQLFHQNLTAHTIQVETDRDVVLIGKSLFGKALRYLNITQAGYTDLLEKADFTHRQPSPFGDAAAAFLNSFEEQVLRTDTERRHHLNFIYGELKGGEPWQLRADDSVPIFNQPSSSSAAVRLYTFAKQQHHYPQGGTVGFLEPPHGHNFLDVLRGSASLRQEITRLFEKTQQKLLVRVAERGLEVVQELDGVIYSYPYTSTADTLQRLIFYLAAIESNDHAVILLEEPEAHSYPVYVSKMGRHIVESEKNQFFIATHSPYLFDGILEDMLINEEQAGELAIFAAYYEDHQTKVHQLSDEEIRGIRADSIDVFYNMKRFTTGRIDA
jgi:hypothetical protein